MKTLRSFLAIGAFLLVSVASTVGAQSLQEKLTDHFKEKDAHGVVQVTKGDEIIHTSTFGHADFETKTPNTINTIYNVGSIGKMFTGIVALQFVQEGKLSLETKVGDVIKDYFNSKEVEEVTIYQLLTHSSGLGSYFAESWYQEHFLNLRSTEDYGRYLNNITLNFEPGTGFQYSNTAVLLLGYILQEISGQPFEDLIQEKIFDPLNMNSSGYFMTDEPIANRATGYYENQEGKVLANYFVHSVRGTPAGGVYTNIPDIRKFYKAILNHELINQELTDKMLTPQVKNTRSRNPNSYVGLIVSLNSETGDFGHSGGAPGISNYTRYFPEQDMLVMIMMNKESSRDVRNIVLEHYQLFDNR